MNETGHARPSTWLIAQHTDPNLIQQCGKPVRSYPVRTRKKTFRWERREQSHLKSDHVMFVRKDSCLGVPPPGVGMPVLHHVREIAFQKWPQRSSELRSVRFRTFYRVAHTWGANKVFYYLPINFSVLYSIPFLGQAAARSCGCCSLHFSGSACSPTFLGPAPAGCSSCSQLNSHVPVHTRSCNRIVQTRMMG